MAKLAFSKKQPSPTFLPTATFRYSHAAQFVVKFIWNWKFLAGLFLKMKRLLRVILCKSHIPTLRDQNPIGSWNCVWKTTEKSSHFPWSSKTAKIVQKWRQRVRLLHCKMEHPACHTQMLLLPGDLHNRWTRIVPIIPAMMMQTVCLLIPNCFLARQWRMQKKSIKQLKQFNWIWVITCCAIIYSPN